MVQENLYSLKFSMFMCKIDNSIATSETELCLQSCFCNISGNLKGFRAFKSINSLKDAMWKRPRMAKSLIPAFNCWLLIDATDLKFSETVQTNAFSQQQLNHNHFNTFPVKLCHKQDQKDSNNFSNILPNIFSFTLGITFIKVFSVFNLRRFSLRLSQLSLRWGTLASIFLSTYICLCGWGLFMTSNLGRMWMKTRLKYWKESLLVNGQYENLYLTCHKLIIWKMTWSKAP